MSGESRQVRRARERREQFDRIHGRVLASRSIREMWLTYAQRFVKAGIDLDDPSVAVMQETFYAGVAAMFELMQRVSPDEVSEDVGIEMLNRLHEELDTYTKGLR